MRVLLAGGAGYLGSHVAVSLIEANHQVLVVDNLANSSRDAITRVERLTRTEIPFLPRDIRDKSAVTRFVRDHAPIDAILHLAGLKSVGESVSHPVEYYDTNLSSTIAILKLMSSEKIPTMIFSSSATVYAPPLSLPLTEESPTGLGLSSPYGKTKRMIEEILQDFAAANPELRIVTLRYFNPVGAHPSGLIGESPQGVPNNLLPFVAQVAAGARERVGIFGSDYDTPDGTGQRDYVHVMDLAEAHVAALEHAKHSYETYNLGSGIPVSVKELIAAFERATGIDIPTVLRPRRPGDVATSYCDSSKANRDLGWAAKRSIEDACRDAWRWQSENPTGYAGRAAQRAEAEKRDTR